MVALDAAPLDQMPDWAPLLTCLQEHAGLDEATLLAFDRSDTGLQITKYANHGGDNPELTRQRNAAWFAAGQPWSFDLTVPSLDERERVVATVSPRLALTRAAETDAHLASILHDFEVLGIAGRRQLRQLICDGPLLLGWLGGVGNRPLVHAAPLLHVLAYAAGERLRVSSQLARQVWSAAALPLALDALDAPAWVLDAKGTPHHMNRGALDWWARANKHARLGLLDAALAPGSPMQACELRGSGLPSMWLVLARRRPPIEAMTAGLTLTPRQREVAHLVLSGASNRTIAAQLGISERTAEIHVARVLAAADVRTRAQLLARVR
jgi:DNA-binding CsgD family transcriptional regulator